ncbi:hypothetical protein PG994_006670 [Apiospora phragmitis]|uniref:Uncharacterized protein n=1 Tax=Apiospora phragmitis TaxID=2905665 RepID=A0ABR1VJC7_9PEZI
MANDNSSNTASDAAADANLRAFAEADHLDCIDEALANQDLVPTAPWGMAVYRTAYGDEVAWRRMLDQLETTVAESLDMHGRSDLLARHQLVVFEDAATLDGVVPDEVRARFTQWAGEELRRHWRPEKERRRTRRPRGGWTLTARVGEICLESLDHMSYPVVMLMRKAWVEEAAAGNHAEEGKEEEEEEEGYNDEEDIGWMYLPVLNYVECCNQLHDTEVWDMGCYVAQCQRRTGNTVLSVATPSQMDADNYVERLRGQQTVRHPTI